MVETRTTSQTVPLEPDVTQRNWLHPVAGSEAAKVEAGLFMNPQE